MASLLIEEEQTCDEERDILIVLSRNDEPLNLCDLLLDEDD